MIVPLKYDHFGYKYLGKVNVYTRHSGVDLNWGKPYEDYGLPVSAIANGTVVYSNNVSGWGNMIVLYHSQYGCWSRYAHLKESVVSMGTKVKEGQTIGYCGDTGGDWSPHLHFDIIIKELPTWTSYTKFWSISKVQEYYADPLKYIAETNELEKIEDPIVTWNKKHKIIEKWDRVPSPEDIKMGWVAYKTAKQVVCGNLKKSDFNL